MHYSISSVWKNADPRALSRIIFALAVAALLCIPADVMALSFSSYALPSGQATGSILPAPLENSGAEETAAYRQAFRSSRAFGVMSASPDLQEPASFEKLLSGLSLKGIVSLGSPEAILERKDKKTTFFVQTGDSFEGLTVKEVREDSIVFSDGTRDEILKIGGA